ncbi:hypothetical protein IIU_06974 [Bacillus cereus VD133]|uniref:Uncharacterized protein n=1 Tax=Bacillus cereus VD133 TaxID=1053233 RepID=A0A9W5PJ85_BACCE|nr:hypothetical protein [Bacillus cereus]EOO23567.1 hypothetical protein IIU_06974 [Bacillus cereus VD133]
MKTTNSKIKVEIMGMDEVKSLIEKLSETELEVVLQWVNERESESESDHNSPYKPPYETELPLKTRVREIMRMLEGLTYMQWQAIEREVNHEYSRLANKNILRTRECMLKNVLQDESFSTPAATEVENKIDIELDGRKISELKM